MSYRDAFKETADIFSKEIKTGDALNPYSYMVLSTGLLFDVFFEIIESTETEDVPLTLKNIFINNVKKLNKSEIKNIYKVFLYDYFSFAKQFMTPEFIKNFPIPFEQFENDFKKHFQFNQSDEKLFKETQMKYSSGFHARYILKLLKLPKEQDDVFLVMTLEELKHLTFHRFNKTIINYIDLNGKGGEEFGKKLRKLRTVQRKK